MDNYIPGVCNIGKKEREFRRNIGIVSLVVSIIYFLLLVLLNLGLFAKLLIFIPIFASAVSYLQYKMHFCAEFGIIGKYNFSEKVGRTISVEEAEYLLKDRAKALKILLYSLAIAFVTTAIVTILF